jgi:hypothetical protein
MGMAEYSFLMQIDLNNTCLKKIIYHPLHECLWAHSDYFVYKWRVNLVNKLVDSREKIALPSD